MERAHIHGSEELILIKCPYYPKSSVVSQQSQSKYNGTFYTHTHTPTQILITIFGWNFKRFQITKAISRKINKTGSLIIPDLKL